ncbi:MAG: SRPBCC family protein [Acidobacteriaceae bacterium]
MKIREFKSEIWLPLGPEKLFPFFADAANLEALTPQWLNFKILTPRPIEMREGSLIEYKLAIHGLPVRWRTRISVWQPPHQFVDEQLSGPYQRWIHQHDFDACDGGTRVRDVVKYAVPFDFAVHRWLVRPDIEKIFRYRSEELQRRFGVEDSSRE